MQFDGAGSNNNPEAARAGYKKALGRRILYGTGIVIGVPLAIPLGIGLGAVVLALAAPVALVGAGVYGGMKIAEAL